MNRNLINWEQTWEIRKIYGFGMVKCTRCGWTGDKTETVFVSSKHWIIGEICPRCEKKITCRTPESISSTTSV